MANKNKKSPAQQAAEEAAAQQAPKTENPTAVAMMNGVKRASLSPDATVQALKGLKEMIHDNPNAAAYYNLSEDTIHTCS